MQRAGAVPPVGRTLGKLSWRSLPSGSYLSKIVIGVQKGHHSPGRMKRRQKAESLQDMFGPEGSSCQCRVKESELGLWACL